MPVPHWQISYDNLTNPEDYLMPSAAADPLQILIHTELEQEAEANGFESVEDYLFSNPEILIH